MLVCSTDFTIYTLGIETLSYTNSSPLHGENLAFAHFAAVIAIHYNIWFHQVLITTGWTEAVGYERFARHLHTWLTA